MRTLDADSIIVLGGSFNPPTVAHRLILEHAMSQTGAGHGVLVPSSANYVARKARKQGSPFLFTEQERLAMLEAMAAKGDGLSVSTCEYGDDGRGHTYRTMCRIREENPGRTCCFLTGADKLPIIPRWHDAEAFLKEFPFVVMSRSGDDARAAIRRQPLLRAHMATILVIPDLPGTEAISSSRFQELRSKGDPRAANLVEPEVLRIVDEIERRKGHA